LQYVKSNDVMT